MQVIPRCCHTEGQFERCRLFQRAILGAGRIKPQFTVPRSRPSWLLGIRVNMAQTFFGHGTACIYIGLNELCEECVVTVAGPCHIGTGVLAASSACQRHSVTQPVSCLLPTGILS